MNIVQDVTTTQAAATSKAITISATTAGNTLILLATGSTSSRTISSITGATFTLIRGYTSTGLSSQQRHEAWISTGIAAGITSITVNWSAAVDACYEVIEASDISGYDDGADTTGWNTNAAGTAHPGTFTYQTYDHAVTLGLIGYKHATSNPTLDAAWGWTALNSASKVGPAGTSNMSMVAAWREADFAPQHPAWTLSASAESLTFQVTLKSTDSAPTPVIWGADHDTGTAVWEYDAASDPDGANTNGGGDECSGNYDAVTYSTDQAKNGTKSAKLTIGTPNTPTSGIRLFRYAEPQEDSRSGGLFYSAWFYIPSDRVPNGDPYWSLFQFKSSPDQTSTSNPAWWLNALDFSGTLRLTLVWDGDALNLAGPYSGNSVQHVNYNQTIADVPIGAWFHIEVQLVKSNAYDGLIRVWQDDVLIFEKLNVRTGYTWTSPLLRGRNCDNVWSLNNYGDGFVGDPQDTTLYIDQARIATSRQVSPPPGVDTGPGGGAAGGGPSTPGATGSGGGPGGGASGGGSGGIGIADGPARIVNCRHVGAAGTGAVGLRVSNIAYAINVRATADTGVRVDAGGILRTSALQYPSATLTGNGVIIPLFGDRAVYDALNYQLSHANDIDTTDGIHHTLGAGATQAAPGNHTHNIYLVYSALLTQSGSNAPVATVLENTLGHTVAWGRSDVGQYSGSLTDSSFPDTTFILTSALRNVGVGGMSFIYGGRNSSASTIALVTAGISSGSSVAIAQYDDLLTDAPIEIRIYI